MAAIPKISLNYGGGDTPHLLRHMGGRVTPTLKERGGGGWGGTPSPPCPHPAPFLHGRILWFAWNLRRKPGGVRFFWELSRIARPGPEGEGVPPCCPD